jgi:hypothetical protein
MILITTRKDGPKGFQSLLDKRASMQKWSHLETFLAHGRNREAAAIVESFENQLINDYAFDQFCLVEIA